MFFLCTRLKLENVLKMLLKLRVIVFQYSKCGRDQENLSPVLVSSRKKNSKLLLKNMVLSIWVNNKFISKS